MDFGRIGAHLYCKKILGIRVLDHIIFGDSDYYSFADAGLLT
jgi:DNA repair protein RadC